MNPIEQTNHHCPLCGEKLERKEAVWICYHCLLIWHGDTFEPIEPGSEGQQALDDWFA
jgi:ribosomal protein L37AE/L43A